MTITIGGSNITLNSGSVLQDPPGTAPSYLCRAWVNFNGTGTVAIRGSGNVSSITDNGVGDYTVNFSTAITDTNYALVFGASGVAGGGNSTGKLAINDNVGTPVTTTSVRVVYVGTVFIDPPYAYVAAFR